MKLIVLLLFTGFLVADAYKVLVNHEGSVLEIDDIDPLKTTVAQVKLIIEEKTKITILDQRLVFSGRLIKDDNKKLSELGDFNPISINFTLMDPLDKSGYVFVEIEKRIKTVFVTRKDTIKHLLELAGIAGLEGLKHRRAFFDGIDLENEEATVEFYEIYKGAHIRVFNQNDVFPVIVKTPEGITITLEIETTIDVRGLKHMIEEREGTPMFDQRLVHKDLQLFDHEQVISHCLVPAEGLMVTMAKSLREGGNVHVIFEHGKSMTLYVVDTDTVYHLKERIGAEVGVSPDKLKLMYNNGHVVLEDNSLKLGRYELYEGVTIHAIRKEH